MPLLHYAARLTTSVPEVHRLRQSLINQAYLAVAMFLASFIGTFVRFSPPNFDVELVFILAGFTTQFLLLLFSHYLGLRALLLALHRHDRGAIILILAIALIDWLILLATTSHYLLGFRLL